MISILISFLSFILSFNFVFIYLGGFLFGTVSFSIFNYFNFLNEYLYNLKILINYLRIILIIIIFLKNYFIYIINFIFLIINFYKLVLLLIYIKVIIVNIIKK